MCISLEFVADNVFRVLCSQGGADLEARNHRFFREITISDFLRFRNTVQLYTQPEKSFFGLKRDKNGV